MTYLRNYINHYFSPVVSSGAISHKTFSKFIHSSSRKTILSLVHFPVRELALRLSPSWGDAVLGAHLLAFIRCSILIYSQSKRCGFLMIRNSIFAIEKELYVGVAG